MLKYVIGNYFFNKNTLEKDFGADAEDIEEEEDEEEGTCNTNAKICRKHSKAGFRPWRSWQGHKE